MDCGKIEFGLISLFPLSGYLKKLKGFYLGRFRDWFLILSTIFSLAIYYFLQWHFDKLESLPFYISPWYSLFLAVLSLFIYIGILLSVKSKYQSYSSCKRVSSILVSLLFFMLTCVFLTYTFNYYVESRDFIVVRGTVESESVRISNEGSIEINYQGIEQDKSHIIKKMEISYLF